MLIAQYGKTLEKLYPDIIGKSFKDHFEITRPQTVITDFSSLCSQCNQLVVLSCNDHKKTKLRGQFEFLPDSQQVLFVGSPWFDSIEQVIDNNLHLSDFAFHDPMIDLLHVLKTQEINNEDLKQLLNTVNKQKNALKEAAREIHDIALFPMQNPDPLIRIDTQGNVLSQNASADKLNLFYYQDKELQAKEFWCEISQELQMDSGRKSFEVFAGPTLFSFVVVSIPESRYYNIYGRDITEQKKNEEKVELLSLVASANDNGVLFTDASGAITWVNEGYCKLTGFERKEILGRTPLEIGVGPLTDKAEVKSGLLDPFYKGQKFNAELIHYRKDGSWFWSRSTGQAVFDQEGNVSQYFTILVDITAEKTREEQLMILSSIAAENNRGVVIADKGGKVEWVNKSFEAMSGYTLAELLNKIPGRLLQGEDTDPETVAYLSKQILLGEPFTCEILNYHKNGRPYWLLIQGQALRDKEGNIFKYFAIEEDITVKKETEQKLKEFESRFRLALEKIGDNVWEHDFRTGITIFSNSEHNLLGLSIDDTTATEDIWWSSVFQEDIPLLEDNDRKYRQGVIDHHLLEYRLWHSDGTLRWVLDRGVVIEKDRKGFPLKIIGTHTDITNQKNAEQELLETKKKLESIFNEMSDVVWSQGWQDQLLSFITPSAEKLFGPLTQAGPVKSNWWEDFVLPEDKSVIDQIHQQIKEQGHWSAEYRIQKEQGTTSWVSNSGRIIYDTSLKPIRLDGIIRNINERKVAEETIRHQVDMQNILIDISATYININLDYVEAAIQNSLKGLGEFVKADRAYIFTYDFQEGVISNTYEWCAEGISAEIENLQKVPLMNFPLMIELHRQGKPYYVPDVYELPDEGPDSMRGSLERQGIKSLLTLPMIRNGVLLGFVGFDSVQSHHNYTNKEKKLLFLFTQMLINVSDRKEWEIQLQRQEEKYRNIITNMKLGLLEVDSQENVLFANQSFCEMSGLDLNDLLGRNKKVMIPFDSPPVDNLKDTPQYQTRTFETSVRDQGGETRWWFVSEAPNFNDKGEQIGKIGIYLDITDHKNLERDLLEAKEHAEASTRAKELFLANMSHEIRTPMNAIIGMSGQLEKTPLNADQKFYLNTIHSAADNLLIVINDILDLSKIEAGKLTLEKIGFEPKLIVGRAMHVMMHKAEEKGLEFTNSYCDPGLSPVLIGDPYRLNQILLNLISNAIKFTEKGKVDLTCKILRDTPSHQTIRVSVADTGIGMDEAFVRNLFQKFSQEDNSITRRYGGTGLGMSICKELVELMKGSIEVQSKKDVGTVISFTIEFAKGRESDLPVRESKVVNTKILDNKKILVVDDNDMNRLVASTILKNYGATIKEAGNGSIAISMLQREHFDLVLMDVQMPVMDGVEATRIIRENISEQLPIIALTALAIKGDDTRLISQGMNDYLSKPFEANQLLHIISKWLLKETVPVPQNKVATPPPRQYDLKKLTSIANGDEDFVQKMITLFIEQSKFALTEMRSAFEVNNLDVLQKTAHRLKPSIDTLDIHILKDEIRLLEKAEEHGLIQEEINTRLTHIEEVLGRVIEDLKKR